MKKFAVMAMLALSTTFLSGCLGSGYANNYGMSSSMPGMLYSNQTLGNLVLPKAESLAGVTVLGPVCGKATSLNVLLLVSVGDCGIYAAKQDALKRYPNADDIINIEIDAHHDSILSIYNLNTITLRGLAIKYKKACPAQK